ncbi:3-hydroxy-3-methylglutaryl-coenzyme A reductase 1-like [Impatiens glandulifera]|uniref:3-hydroxy-3-methylglutaryl-coenzyme A reductase 1-like n=1 Tax=Impatiens glandulifera TaxID=253017 RepID=UPI001FB0A240|nr:3-hydroxy-3-methylglutaryl-coenzyme A reductase 1-like [Impatiens glandulifera]
MNASKRTPVKSLRPSKAAATAAAASDLKPNRPAFATPPSHHIYHTTSIIFFAVFFSVAYFLLYRWRNKIRNSQPLHVVTLPELGAVISLVASTVYLVGFIGVDFVHSLFTGKSPQNIHLCAAESESKKKITRVAFRDDSLVPHHSSPASGKPAPVLVTPGTSEEIVKAVVAGTISSYSLESKLQDCKLAAAIRREALQRMTGKSLVGMPLEGFDYESILDQCCEMPVGYVQIPVGIAGPLLLNGREYSVPMATTEGCLVASTNRGCKAIYLSGGASSVLLKDSMTRAPVVRFPSAKRAAEVKFFLEDPMNFDNLAIVFNKTSRFARLKGVKCGIAGKNLYPRFSCSTGDAMGMNMVSKGVQNVLDYLQAYYTDMDVMGISGNFCSDKKPAAVNWIEGRGKSVVCEAVIKEEVVKKVLKTNVASLVELNVLKNLAGSALAGSLGGFNAHSSNIVSALFLATGQDPAQNVESSNCITMMEAINDGTDLHISVTMPSIEVGTVGGGTQLASQAACLNLLGVKGANQENPGANARQLASIVAGAVLAGELSLMAALASGQLVKSHMKYNRSTSNSS